MRCIIVDDEPLGRKAVELLIQEAPPLHLCGNFGDAVSAGAFIQNNPVDLIFLDIKMPGSEWTRFCPDDPKGYFNNIHYSLCGIRLGQL